MKWPSISIGFKIPDQRSDGRAARMKWPVLDTGFNRSPIEERAEGEHMEWAAAAIWLRRFLLSGRETGGSKLNCRFSLWGLSVPLL